MAICLQSTGFCVLPMSLDHSLLQYSAFFTWLRAFRHSWWYKRSSTFLGFGVGFLVCLISEFGFGLGFFFCLGLSRMSFTFTKAEDFYR